jgi:hypothetical protein
MAGTGHKYEVSNPTRVGEYAFQLRMLAYERQLESAEEWLKSKHFIKYLTSPTFTFRLKPAHVANSLIPDERRGHIFSKVAAGDEVRRFDSELFETLGPDIAHVLDWIADLKANNSPTYRKIARMETPVLVAKAEAWTKSLNSKRQTSDGIADPVLSITHELTWFELKDSRALQWEGIAMSHCVGATNYSENVERGNTRIFSLRKGVDKSILTLEVRSSGDEFSLVQIQKKGNGGLPVAYCDATVALLNAFHIHDNYNVARRYALCRVSGNWMTVFDTWDTAEFHGRKVLTDGKSILFMSVTDATKPLAVVEYLLVPEIPGRWYEEDFSPEYVRLKASDDIQPHYLDQVECCSLADIFSKERPHLVPLLRLSWMSIKNSRFVPSVDALDHIEMVNGVYYARRNSDRVTLEYHLPHSSDPARLIMTVREKNHRLIGHIPSGQRISRAEHHRALAFLTATRTKWIDHNTDGASHEATKSFVAACGPELLPNGEWRSFSTDMVETAAKGTSGKWQETDYLIRYHNSAFGMVNIYLNSCFVSHTLGTLMDKRDLMELSNKLRERRVVSDQFLHLSIYGNNDRFSALYMQNGRWKWVDEKNFVSRAKDVTEATERTPGSVGIATISGILGQISYLLKKEGLKNKKLLADLKARLLVVWFLHTPTFSTPPFRRTRLFPLFGSHSDYPVIDRMIDLSDLGYKLDDKKSKSQFRKFLEALSESYGKGRIQYASETEYLELLARWHRHLPKKYLNKIASTWITCTFLNTPSNGPPRILEILDNPGTWRTRFRETIFSQAERLVADTDYLTVDQDSLDGLAKLFLVVVKSRYMYGSYVEALARLVAQLEQTEAGDPETRSELRMQLDKLEEKELRIEAKAA